MNDDAPAATEPAQPWAAPPAATGSPPGSPPPWVTPPGPAASPPGPPPPWAAPEAGQPGPAPGTAGWPPPAGSYPGSPAPGPAPWLQQPGQRGYGYPGQAGQYSGTNGFAVASFALSIVGFFGFPLILSAVFGIVALVQIRDRQQRGKGFAIAGLAISGAWILLLALIIILGAVAGPQTSG